MFKTIRYTIAIHRALDEAVARGLIRKHKRKIMVNICGNGPNREFGVASLRTGTARSSAAAAAAVFARIAVSAQNTPHGEVTYDDWASATRQAFLNGGAAEIESFMLAAELITSMGGRPNEGVEDGLHERPTGPI